jgi:hypothetical protein
MLPAKGEYCATGRTFLKLAKAHASLRHGPGDEDAELQAVLRLLEGSSLDLRMARRARAGMEVRDALGRMTEMLRAPLLRHPVPDLVGYFETVTSPPLIEACDLAETYDLWRETGKLDLFADDLAAMGLGPGRLATMEPAAVRRLLKGRSVPRQWRFMPPPCGVMIARDATPLDPGEFVPGAPLDHLPWSIPRLRLGWAYWPGIAPCVDLDLRVDDLRRLEWETGYEVASHRAHRRPRPRS